MTGFPDAPIDGHEYVANTASIIRRWFGSKWTTDVVACPDYPLCSLVYVNPRTGQAVKITIEEISTG